MNHADSPSNPSTVILAFLAGAATGATLLALAAPRAGTDLREGLEHLGSRIRRKAGQVADKAEEAWEDTEDRLTGK
jgi:gas vesicle protein